MLNFYSNFYYFSFFVLFVVSYLMFRYFINKKEIKESNNLEIIFSKINSIFAYLKAFSEKYFKNISHSLLHILVISLKFISNLTDKLYEKSRDLFLQTATKEKQVVAKFWSHLKEYKKEKEIGTKESVNK